MTDDEILDIAIPKLGDWNGSILPFARSIIAQARAELIAELVPAAFVRRGHYGGRMANIGFQEAVLLPDVNVMDGTKFYALPDSIIPATKEGS